jgi:hypothetical protein
VLSGNTSAAAAEAAVANERPKMILRSVADLRMVVGMDERRS